MQLRSIIAAAGLAALASASFGQIVVAEYSTPSMDRWMYPFNFSAGSEGRAALFSPGVLAGFDDRDAQMLVGFDTNAEITPGLGRLRYKVLSATLSVFIENDQAFWYDPSADSIASSLPSTDPDYVADSDPGRPIEVWACGYRNGYTAETFGETEAFGGVPIVAPAEGARNVFPALLDYAQTPTDVSRQVRLKQTGSAMALARLFDESNAELAPGAVVPEGTEVRFNLATVSSANYVYLQHALNTGLVRLMIASLEATTGGPGGGTGGVTYPRIYTRENAAAEIGYGPQLSLEIAITCDADFNGDNFVDDSDFVFFAASYNELLDARCDLNEDTFTDDADFVIFAAAYDALLCD
ncbi:MAG: hypothetical protein JNM86_05795 [Phycisphaerae bacterium]|nr:hypothetical protein [Phycisphaerae bacterium]MBN8597034.1 hypothetical protein [Planctomycetota bacterium]